MFVRFSFISLLMLVLFDGKLSAQELSARYVNQFNDTMIVKGKSVVFSGIWKRAQLTDRTMDTTWVSATKFLIGSTSCEITTSRVMCVETDTTFRGFSSAARGVYERVGGIISAPPIVQQAPPPTSPQRTKVNPILSDGE